MAAVQPGQGSVNHTRLSALSLNIKVEMVNLLEEVKQQPFSQTPMMDILLEEVKQLLFSQSSPVGTMKVESSGCLIPEMPAREA